MTLPLVNHSNHSDVCSALMAISYNELTETKGTI